MANYRVHLKQFAMLTLAPAIFSSLFAQSPEPKPAFPGQTDAPPPAPSGMMFYTGDLFPEWKGNLFVGALAGRHLVPLILKGERVVAEEKLLVDLKQRIRYVRQDPDGSIYILTGGGGLLRLTPKR